MEQGGFLGAAMVSIGIVVATGKVVEVVEDGVDAEVLDWGDGGLHLSVAGGKLAERDQGAAAGGVV